MQAAGIAGTTMTLGTGTTRTTTATITAGMDGIAPGITVIVPGTTDITATMARAGMVVAMCVHLLIAAV